MRTAGFEGQIAPSQDNSMQWLGKLIANEDRYSEAAVKFWWPSLMGAPVLEPPAASEDKDFAINLAAFEIQNRFIKELGKKFSKGIEGGAAYNGKDLLTSMVLSEWFRADEVENWDVRDRLVSELGTRRLLTPEELEKKSRSLLGWTWGRYAYSPEKNAYDFDGKSSHLDNMYNIYYGGTDSDGITERASALTALMVNVAEKQALDMTCPAVMVDFDREDSDRLLFSGIKPEITPDTDSRFSYRISAESLNNKQTFRDASELSAGEKTLSIGFANDYYRSSGDDRDLYITNIEVTDPNGNLIFDADFSEYNNDNLIEGVGVGNESISCGDYWFSHDSFKFYGSGCTLDLPFSASIAGAYEVSISGWGVRAETDDDLPELTVSIASDAASGKSNGAMKIKAVIVNLHKRLLGQSLDITDPEINMTYQVLVDAWQARKTWIAETNNNNVAQWPNSLCNYYLPEHVDEGGISSRGNDSSGMKNSWQVVLAYLMTDFNYLHE
jgi:hypothetical protein